MTLHEGWFTSTATSAGDELAVRIDGLDGGVGEFAVAWAPRIGDDGAPVFPSRDDWAAVEETELGTWCVLLWTPSGD